MGCGVCYTLDGEDRGMTGAFPLAPLRPQSTAVFTKSAVVGLGPLPLGAWMFTVEERRARNREAQRRYRAADPERYREAVRRYVAIARGVGSRTVVGTKPMKNRFGSSKSVTASLIPSRVVRGSRAIALGNGMRGGCTPLPTLLLCWAISRVAAGGVGSR